MNLLPAIIRDFNAKKWPTLEVSNFTKGEKLFLIAFYILDLAYSWNTFLSGPRAEMFGYPIIVPVILLLLKSRMFFMSFLITFQITVAFLCIGNAEDMLKYTFAFTAAIITISNTDRGYYAAIISLFFFFLPRVQYYSIEHIIIFFLIVSLITNTKLFFGYNRSNKLNMPLMILFLWINLSVFWSVSLRVVLESYFDIFSLFAIYWLTLIIINEEEKIYKVLIIWAFCGFFYGFARSFFTPSDKELMGLFTAKNTVSSLLNYSIFCIMALINLKKLKLHLLYLFLIILIPLSYVIGSKAGFASLLIGIALYLILMDCNRKKRRRKLLKATSVLITLFLVAQIPLVPLVYTKLKHIPLPIEMPMELQTIFFRFEQWEIGEQMLTEESNYYLGTGIYGYATLYSEFYSEDTKPKPWQNHPHSLYMYVFFDYGVVGLILFILMMVIFYWILTVFLLRSKNEPIRAVVFMVYIATLSFLVHALVDWALIDKRFWFFLGLGIAAILVDRNSGHPIREMQDDTKDALNKL
ncbi:MAG: O-antigen ligase family protein [FCB group bacterium]|nr:O-antigen ligase family protein [FCB group bacterium]